MALTEPGERQGARFWLVTSLSRHKATPSIEIGKTETMHVVFAWLIETLIYPQQN